MEKAKIYVLDANGKVSSDKTITVLYNPTEYKNAISVEWAEKENDIPEFKKSKLESFSATFLFDTYELGKDVRENNTDQNGKEIKGTRALTDLTLPTTEGEQTKSPPVCVFSWGKFNYKGVMEKVDVNYTMFLSDGTPVRAKASITIKPILDAKEMLKLKGAEACRKLYMVKLGDRLDIIAAQKMKDPTRWKLIAEENNIQNPLSFPEGYVGETLIIPDV